MPSKPRNCSLNKPIVTSKRPSDRLKAQNARLNNSNDRTPIHFRLCPVQSTSQRDNRRQSCECTSSIRQILSPRSKPNPPLTYSPTNCQTSISSKQMYRESRIRRETSRSTKFLPV